MQSNHLILCCPLLLPPSIFPSIRVFSNESVLHIRWPKNWSFSFSISPSNKYSGLTSFRMDWLDLLAVQGTLKSLLQHTIRKHPFFGAQPLCGPTITSIHDYWRNHSFDQMDLCWQSNILAFQYAMLVITFLPRSKCLLISWLQSPSQVILETKKRKTCHCFYFFPSI